VGCTCACICSAGGVHVCLHLQAFQKCRSGMKWHARPRSTLPPTHLLLRCASTCQLLPFLVVLQQTCSELQTRQILPPLSPPRSAWTCPTAGPPGLLAPAEATCTTFEPSLYFICPPQCLDLSNCCLTRVPPVLATLPRLTSLTLNDNDSLGASGEALAPLSLLTSLQVLGCVLVCMLAKLLGQTHLLDACLGVCVCVHVHRLAW